MGGAASIWLDAGALLLLLGLGGAAVLDARTREVPDRLWQILGILGAIGGGIVLLPDGVLPLVGWSLAAGLALEHVIPWDAEGKGWVGAWADYLELAAYVGVTALLGFGTFRWGLGGGGVPPVALAVLATVIIARVLFEAGVLYGGADAKALIIAGLLVPLFPIPWLAVPSTAQLLTSFVPYAINLLMDAALLSVVVPIVVAGLNLRRREFSLRTGFTSYTMPVQELPRRFVWVRDPAYPVDPEAEAAIETSEQDREWRVRIARELTDRGIPRVRVGPQLPFIVLMVGGALGALLLGNWIVDLLAWL
jgi:prepilin signal peptidase PulO-like enzyme (type II secretory pathway)